MSNEWMTRGNCVGGDAESFHSDYSPVMRTAAKVCNATPCPVIDKCLRYALDHMDVTDSRSDNPDPATAAIGQYGVWGGTLPADRWRILGRRPARYGTAA